MTCVVFATLLFILFIIILDTLPSLPGCSDNDINNVPSSDKGIIVITDMDDDNPPKTVHLIFNTIIHNIQSSICAKTM